MKNKVKFAFSIVGIVLASLILLYMVCAFIVSKVLLDDMFGRAYHDPELTTDYTDEEVSAAYSSNYGKTLQSTEIEFESEGNTLRGNVWKDGNGDKLLVIAHGIGSHANSYYNEMMYFVNEGYIVLTYDCTGTDRSEGKGTTGLSQSPLDLHNALLFVESNNELKDLPVYLFGHSWGGHAVAAVLNFEHKNIKAVASVAGYNSNGGIMLEWMKGTMGMGGFAYPVFPFAAICAYAEAHGAYNYTGVKGINKSDLPVIILQGGKDDTVWHDSLYNHKSEITNKKVKYVFYENQTHNGILNATATDKVDYQKKVSKEYEELEKEYGGEIPLDKEKEFFAGINKSDYNGVNEDTMEEIIKFFAAV